jgi:hypothetical protein
MNKMLVNQISIDEFIQTLKMVRSDIDDQFINELHQLVKFYQGKTDINPIAYLYLLMRALTEFLLTKRCVKKVIQAKFT